MNNALILSETVRNDLTRLARVVQSTDLFPGLERTDFRFRFGFHVPWPADDGPVKPGTRRRPRGAQFIAITKAAFESLCDQAALTRAFLEITCGIEEAGDNRRMYMPTEELLATPEPRQATFLLISHDPFQELLRKLGIYVDRADAAYLFDDDEDDDNDKDDDNEGEVETETTERW